LQERVTYISVTFVNLFSLRDVEGEQAAGTYLIQTTEVPVDSMCLLPFRRLSTTITLPELGNTSLSRQIITIDRADLDDALRRDALTAAVSARRPLKTDARMPPAYKPADSEPGAQLYQLRKEDDERLCQTICDGLD
jgi:hypothetical protein